MQSMGSTSSNVTDRTRVEAVVETLAALDNHGESLGELAHDARNMVTALSLYCDLLEEPGVLSARHRHYGNELRLVAEASRRLVEKLALLDERPGSFRPVPGKQFSEPARKGASSGMRSLGLDVTARINDLRSELEANRNLLAAMAGPFVRLTLHGTGGTLPINLDSEDLTRVLVNLVKNAAESIRGSGSIRIELAECLDFPGLTPCLMLVVEDSGHGIPEALLEKIFETGFTTRPASGPDAGWSARHQGFGLSITRAIVETAGGKIHAENCEHGGARFVIELPVRRP
ncbi:MAG TPA: ATP-binding protein [Terracidiphilus sp.]|nr:ATP-binding protein [Terracidiphilus sp.]